LITVRHLSKKYDKNLAVDDLSMEIEEGRIYGLLGPNGAGKSTTMNIMTGYLAATAGTVEIDGADIMENPREAKKYIGYLPEQPPIYPDMTVREYLDFAAALKCVAKKDISRQVESAMERTGCKDVEHRLIKNLSKGYRQRVGIAQALLGEPKLIILDEPMVGLDPKQIIEIRELIAELGKKHTVILSSHILQEVSAVCDYIYIISRGKLVAHDTPENLSKALTHNAKLMLAAKCTAEQFKEALSGIGNIEIHELPAEEEGVCRAEIGHDVQDDIREAVFFAFADRRIPIYEMDVNKASLEDVFLELTQALPEKEDEEA